MTSSRITPFLLLFAYFILTVKSQNNGTCIVAQKTADGETTYRISDGKIDGICQKRIRPPNKNGGPTVVHVSIFVYFLGSIEAQNLQFTAHVLVQYRWNDTRLIHDADNIEGETHLKDQIWTPHLYLVNEHESKVMGSDKDDVLISIHPDGTVYYATRLKVSLLCFMNLKKFPFDDQQCPLVLESWGYNTSQLILKWEHTQPVRVNKDLKLTEYTMDKFFTNESIAIYSIGDGFPDLGVPIMYHSKFAGNYSSLSVHFELSRQVGHYIMDYYVPSVLLVVVSWVSFWLDPNAVPGRTTLGTSTMLTFITLSRNIGSSLPKVSYIKATEIWFIVCTGFIFGSLVEFAFVNTIWRRRKTVELKKINSKHILKSTLTPQLKRKDNIPPFDRSVSCNSLDDSKLSLSTPSKYGSQLTIDSLSKDPFQFPSISTIAEENTVQVPMKNGKAKNKEKHDANRGFFMLTPQEIAQWIDKRSRVAFPVLFLVFNLFYWLFVYIT